ncbi:MAG TPA: hypothetical protein VHJ17_24170, partial [Thermomonospora sp.]|nr:hypothetical protein [Thermomonospora sp.]
MATGAATVATGVLPMGSALAGQIHNAYGSVSGGDQHTLLITSPDANGFNEVYAVGDNSEGQLGNNSRVSSTVAVKVRNLTHVRSVAGGGLYSVAVKQDGTVWAWGDNSAGQLGDGTTTDSLVPKQVPGISNARFVSANQTGTVLVVLGNGTVVAWGANTGNCAASSTPVTVAGLTGVSTVAGSVASGYSHAVVRLADGTVKTWGDNSHGQLGTGNTTSSCSPVTVPGLTGVTQVSAKGWHTVVRASDGTARAWGRNNSGQLGDGTTTDRLSPITVPGLSGITSVSAGHFHSVAVRSPGANQDREKFSWGDNGQGQLGLGNTTDVSSPTKIPSVDLGGTVMEAGAYHTIAFHDPAFIPQD